MAIANYEALNELLKEGDYNVRVTVGNRGNQTDGAFKELFRDSLGGGIIESKEIMSFVVTGVTDLGTTVNNRVRIEGNKLIDIMDKCSLFDFTALRLDMVTKTSKKTWIIVR